MAPNQGWSLPKAKTRHFDFGGRGLRGTNFPSILSKIVAREEGGKQVKQWQARAQAIKHYFLDKCIIHPMDNAISFLNSYLSGGTTDQRGKTYLSVASGLDKAVPPAVHLHSVASQLICLLKLCIHSFWITLHLSVFTQICDASCQTVLCLNFGVKPLKF